MSVHSRISMMFALWMSAGATLARSEAPLETVRFEIDHVTVLGQSVFVLGDIPQLGGGDVTRAVKLVPGVYDPGPPAGLVWSIDVAIPQGTGFTYSFVIRNDAVSAYSNPANGALLAGPFTGSTSPPTPLVTALRFYRYVGAAVPEVTFHAPGGDVNVSFEPLPGEPDWLLASLAGQPFGRGTRATYNTRDVDTPLHRLVRWGQHVYNYTPDLSASRDGRRETHAVPTQGLIPATRTINGVTGRGIEVWLPRGYDAQSQRRYPVLYMHDGQNVFVPGGAFGTWAAEEAAHDGIMNGRVRELIIVGIDNSSNRLAEYNPDWANSDNADYNAFIVDVLKPWVDATYRTLDGPAHTGVCGSSFGGVATLSLIVNYPDVFGRAAALSTSFWATGIQNQITPNVPSSTRIYIDAGDVSDGAAATIGVRDALLADGRVLHENLFFQLGFGQQHNEAAWRARIPVALEALFPIRDEANTIDLPGGVAGDANGDGCVNLPDLLLVLGQFGLCAGDAGFDPQVDQDGSGCVNLPDLLLVLGEFGSGCP